MNIKVQIFGDISVNSVCGANNLNDCLNPLTFIAFSDKMKARVLEQFIKSPNKIGLSITDEPNRTGEWHESSVENAIYNR